MPKVQYEINRGLHEVAGKGLSLRYFDFITGNTANFTATAVAITQTEGEDADVSGTTAPEIL